MTRTLPWLQGKSSVKQTTLSTTVANSARGSNRPSSAFAPSPKRRRLSSPADFDDGLPTGVSTPDRRRALRTARTPSTSPPLAPPDQQVMREGLAYDDIWMMVEDEFYATAKLYTSHLHHAEYQRLKKQAVERETKAILRPVDPRTKLSIEAQRGLQREEKGKNVAKAMGKALGDEDAEDDDPWVGTQLAGLMESPKKSEHLKAARMGAGKSHTRAAAGLEPRQESPSRHVKQAPKREKAVQASQHSTDDEDDDDLDAPLRARSAKFETSRSSRLLDRDTPSSARKEKHTSPPQERSTQPLADRHHPRTETPLQQSTAHSLSSKHTTTRKVPTGTLSETQNRSTSGTIPRQPSPSKPAIPDFGNGGFPAHKQPQRTAGSLFLARRREAAQARKAKEEQDKKETAVIAEVPTFLF